MWDEELLQVVASCKHFAAAHWNGKYTCVQVHDMYVHVSDLVIIATVYKQLLLPNKAIMKATDMLMWSTVFYCAWLFLYSHWVVSGVSVPGLVGLEFLMQQFLAGKYSHGYSCTSL